MLFTYVISISLVFGVIYAGEISNDQYLTQFDDNILHEGSPFFDKIKATLSVMKSEIDRKLEALEKHIPENLEETINRKIYALEHKIPDRLEEYFDGKFHKLEKKLLDKLEEYMNEKIDLMEKKLNVLEKTIPKDMDSKINNMGVFIDILMKKIPDFDKKINCQLNTVTNNTDKNINHKDDTNHQSDEIDTKIPNICNGTVINYKSDVLNNKAPDLAEHLSRKLDSLKKMIPNLEGNISRKLEELDKKILEKLEKDGLRCKERVARGYNYKPLYRIDNETLNHVPLKRNKAGNITYFEMHIAIKAAKDGLILLSPVPEPSTSDRVFEICVGIANNQQTDLRLNLLTNSVGNTNTPDILTPTYYESFYIKIANGKLEFGKENSNTPLISYKDELLNSVKYFGFGSWDNHEAKYLYDCPL